MKSPRLIFCSLLFVPVAMAETDPQQNGKQFGDGAGLPKYLAHYDVKGPNGGPDGTIDQEERQVMEQARLQIRHQLRQDWDSNGDGKICVQEQEQARVQLRQMIAEHRLARFEEADVDDDGVLSRAEFETLPGIVNKLDTNPDMVDAIFARLDADGDGSITVEEFLAAVRQCDRDRDGSGGGKQRGDGNNGNNGNNGGSDGGGNGGGDGGGNGGGNGGGGGGGGA